MIRRAGANRPFSFQLEWYALAHAAQQLVRNRARVRGDFLDGHPSPQITAFVAGGHFRRVSYIHGNHVHRDTADEF